MPLIIKGSKHHGGLYVWFNPQAKRHLGWRLGDRLVLDFVENGRIIVTAIRPENLTRAAVKGNTTGSTPGP